MPKFQQTFNETRLLYATVVVEKSFDESNQRSMPLAPGLFVDVELVSSESFSGLQVPRSALRNGNQVYVIKDKKIQIKPVNVISTSSEWVILNANNSDITNSLQAGEEVITSAVPGAHNGMRVTLKDLSNSSESDINNQEELPDEKEEVMTEPSTASTSS